MLEAKVVDAATLKNAIETRDGRALAAFYAEDASIRIIDKQNPPSRPRELAGKTAISAFWDDVCSRDMEHKVDATVDSGNRIALTETCAYPDGTRVFCAAMIDIADGHIVRQTMIQAWDE
ncbi:UNVERIFIED_ORG: nuclear transport factor 2 family protein [Roseateles sp. XES5]|nr:nuclear transport factor 2 family protein [Roseateles sp. XES5]